MKPAEAAKALLPLAQSWVNYLEYAASDYLTHSVEDRERLKRQHARAKKILARAAVTVHSR
jgi:hypothetical protein